MKRTITPISTQKYIKPKCFKNIQVDKNTHNNTQYHETPKKASKTIFYVTIHLFKWIKWLKANTLSIPNTSKSVDK